VVISTPAKYIQNIYTEIYTKFIQNYVNIYAGCVHQVASTVILNTIPKDKPPFCLDARTSIKEKSWIRRHKDCKRHYLTLASAQRMTEELGESTIVINKGELLQGVLDKASIGPSAFGLVHCVYEVGVITVCCSFKFC
jgi:hypothetical protein